jgi:hypothetical protein
MLALGAGCRSEEKALPDPARPPEPEVSERTSSSAPKIAQQTSVGGTSDAVATRREDNAAPARSQALSSRTGRELAHRAQLRASVAAAGADRVAKWVVSTGDNGALPFVVVDKRSAVVFMFDPRGRLHGAAPALLGVARGDVFDPGAAEKNMYDTQPEERITPSGRFVAERGRGENGEKLVWIDYDSGIALHAVLDVPGQHRRQRLVSPTISDNRISYGCVNVPVAFFRDRIWPIFERTRGIAYVLPENESAASFLRMLERSRSTRAASG